MTEPVTELRAAVDDAVAALSAGADGERARPTLETPPKPELGDYSTNAAMLLAPALSSPPREVAEGLRAKLEESLGDRVKSMEVAGPGFLNLFMADRWHREAVYSVLEGAVAPAAPASAAESVLVEFVSANPTGPLTVASGRGAAYGDSLSRMLELAGYGVQREYYLNDAGAQIRLFADSIAARMSGAEPPEGGYEGEYVAELARELAARGVDPADRDALARLGVEIMRTRIEASLERFRVRFDRWSSERVLLEAGEMQRVIDELRERGHVYERDGAVWLRTSEFGDDKDRVLIRSDGEPTYFATDIAYHRDKLARAHLLIHPLGADHHGYLARMRAAIAALGEDPERYDSPIIQFMHVVEGGERASMSKRRGEFVTLDDLCDRIGEDAARFFLVQRSHETALDLDLELARSQSQDNPVYYVQYAHARIASILRKASRSEEELPAAADAIAAPLGEQTERALIKRLLDLPEEVRVACELRAPHRICAYASATAADFHAFYRDCQVVGAEGPGLEDARLALCVAAKRVIARSLDLIGVSAPERM